jgi:hypothetical protein
MDFPMMGIAVARVALEPSASPRRTQVLCSGCNHGALGRNLHLGLLETGRRLARYA